MLAQGANHGVQAISVITADCQGATQTMETQAMETQYTSSQSILHTQRHGCYADAQRTKYIHKAKGPNSKSVQHQRAKSSTLQAQSQTKSMPV
jgi:hypothetical protein